MNNIGEKLYELRRNNNMSQEQIADLLDVSRQSISKWERGDAIPDIHNLEAISKVFGVSIDSIVIKGYRREERDVRESSFNQTNEQPIRNLIGDEVEDRERLKSQGTLFIIVAVVLYIIAGMSFIFFASVLEGALIFVVFGAIVALATGIIIYGSSLNEKAKRLYGRDGDGGDEDEKKSPTAKIISKILSLIALIVFFILGFQYGIWYIAWIAFPIAGVLGTVSQYIFPIKNDEVY